MGDEAGARGHLRAVIDPSEAYLANNAIDAGRQLQMASAWARLGNIARAEAIARQAEPRTSICRSNVGPSTVARQDRRCDSRMLEQAVQSGYRNVVWMRMHTDLHALAGDPRFEDLAARIERP